MVILDEADRMLDMGFGVQLEAIAGYLPETRQTLMFSATVPPNIMKLAKNYLKDPVRIETAVTNVVAAKIKQELVHVNDDSKHDELVKLLDARSGQIIVFVKTKHGCDRLARRLVRENHSADAIHGDLRQGQRDRVIRGFRKNDVRILVATDVAARGLDIPMLETVINYDLPQCPEDYIHRIGRTGRNGQEGEAICLISGGDRSKWAAIDRLMNPGKAKAEGGYERTGGRGGQGGGKRSFGGSRDGNGGGRSYAPKTSFGERKFGGAPSGDKPSWKTSFKEKAPSSEGRSFGDRSERPARSFERDDRPQYSESAGRKPWSPEGPSQERSFSDRSERPARSFGDRPARSEGDRSDAPKRAWVPEAEFRKQREGGSDRPARSFGDRPQRSEGRSFGDRSERPARSFGDRPARAEGDRSEAPKRAWVPEAEFRKQRGEGSGKPAFGAKKEWSKDAPKKSWGDRDGAKKSFGDKPAFKKEGGFGGAKKFGGSKPFGAKSDGGNGAPRRSRPAA
jgi:superfamily II DNA/RNA helicase